MELSFHVLEIPNDASTTHSVKTQSRVLKADWLILENNEEANLSLNIEHKIVRGFICEDNGNSINQINKKNYKYTYNMYTLV